MSKIPMHLLPELTHSTIRQLPKGVLGMTSAGNSRYLVLNLEEGNEARFTACLVPFNDPEGPLILQGGVQDNLTCLSLGSDWAVEYKFDELSWPGNREPYGRPGVLFVSTDGPILCVRQTSRMTMSDFVFVNLQTSEIVDLPGKAWPTEDWSIWASLEGRKDPRSNALYEHSPVRPAA